MSFPSGFARTRFLPELAFIVTILNGLLQIGRFLYHHRSEIGLLKKFQGTFILAGLPTAIGVILTYFFRTFEVLELATWASISAGSVGITIIILVVLNFRSIRRLNHR